MTGTPEPARSPAPAPDRPRCDIRVLAVVGPTGVGKTCVAEHVALRLSGQIVSADSMQVYRGMDIGTAKPPADERAVPYHCIDLVEPGEPYSAALFQRDARAAISAIDAAGDLPIVVGGTGLYVRAALDDMEFPSGERASPHRRRLEALAVEIGPQALHDRLARVDPAAAAVVHPNNVRRVVRALEMAELGTSYADRAGGRLHELQAFYDTMLVGLTMDREALYERIAARVDSMIADGLQDEVRGLLAQGFRDALTADQAIGYKELVPVVEGRTQLDDAVSAIKQATRRYAKRQLTWFRADPRIAWIDVTGAGPELAAQAVVSLVSSA